MVTHNINFSGIIGKGVPIRNILVLVLVACASSAAAQPVCGDRSKFLGKLGKDHGESVTAMGLTTSGHVLEVLSSKSGSWTIIVTNPDKVTCIASAGQAWEDVERVAIGPST